MGRTLYVSDLDGTLLRSDQKLSQLTVETINSLVERGMVFSYATARSLVTAGRVTAGLAMEIPVVVYNGTFVLENGTQRQLLSNAFSGADAARILDALLQAGIWPIVYSFIGGAEKYSYCEARQSRGMKIFNDSRLGDVRENPVGTAAELYLGEIFHFTCIDEEEKLRPLYERFRDEFQCLFHHDIYSGEPWLEIQPLGATKAEAILALKRLLDCDRIVCFGDGKNDISMFEIADECYAVANADPELRRIATAIIGSNESDGVARWLAENFRV